MRHANKSALVLLLAFVLSGCAVAGGAAGMLVPSPEYAIMKGVNSIGLELPGQRVARELNEKYQAQIRRDAQQYLPPGTTLPPPPSGY